MKKNGRLQIRLPEELKKWATEYSKKRHTTVSELVTRFFVRLREEEDRKHNPVDAEQI